jgi:predicted metalloprotease with PDZ domain
MEVDSLLREKSGGAKSIDDFARAFFGVHDGRIEPLTYTFEDVVTALNEVTPFDWARRLRELLDGHGAGAPLDGLRRGGWQLVYKEESSASAQENEGANGTRDFLYSLGISVKSDGRIGEVYWDSVAFKAGLAPAITILAVDDKAYTHSRLVEAIRASQQDVARPIDLLVRDFDTFRTVRLDYHGGLRHPYLARIEQNPDRLSAILAPRAPGEKVKK